MENNDDKLSNALGLKSLLIALIINNVKVVGFHTAIIFGAALIMIMLSLYHWVNTFETYGLIPLILAFYVLFGYFLRLLPKYNFVSVIGFPILLLVLFELCSLFPSTTISDTLVLYNIPAFVVVDSLYKLFGGIDVQVRWIYLPSVFVPSLFMYLGLRLKIWKQSKSSNAITENDKS